MLGLTRRCLFLYHSFLHDACLIAQCTILQLFARDTKNRTGFSATLIPLCLNPAFSCWLLRLINVSLSTPSAFYLYRAANHQVQNLLLKSCTDDTLVP
ncbi:hypothetical protein FKM82_024066 [Ascaphus truei]